MPGRIANTARRSRRIPIVLATLDRQELDRFARTFEQLFYRGDAATMAAFYAEDKERRSRAMACW
jgi:hypothetical protein